jgi:hypothetical protein
MPWGKSVTVGEYKALSDEQRFYWDMHLKVIAAMDELRLEIKFLSAALLSEIKNE